jgi:hypothetical protein
MVVSAAVLLVLAHPGYVFGTAATTSLYDAAAAEEKGPVEDRAS